MARDVVYNTQLPCDTQKVNYFIHTEPLLSLYYMGVCGFSEGNMREFKSICSISMVSSAISIKLKSIILIKLIDGRVIWNSLRLPQKQLNAFPINIPFDKIDYGVSHNHRCFILYAPHNPQNAVVVCLTLSLSYVAIYFSLSFVNFYVNLSYFEQPWNLSKFDTLFMLSRAVNYRSISMLRIHVHVSHFRWIGNGDELACQIRSVIE